MGKFGRVINVTAVTDQTMNQFRLHFISYCY